MLRIRFSTHALVAVLVLAAVGCSRDENVEGATPEGAAPPTVAGGMGLTPLFGGVVRQVGNYVVELLTHEDGRIEAQVRDQAGQPVPPETIAVTAEVGSGEEQVEIPMVSSEQRFVGTVAGVRGQHDVSIALAPVGQPDVEVAFPAVDLHPVEVTLAPQHSGQVTVVGEHRVEVATQQDGEVFVSVTDLQGMPLPPTVVALPHVTVVTPRGPQVVALQPRGAIYVGTLGAPPPPHFSVRFDLGVRGRWYRGVRVRHFAPLPPTVFVAPPPIFLPPGGWHASWGPRPAKMHHGKGWAKGWGPHHGKVHHGKGWGPRPGKAHPGKGWGSPGGKVHGPYRGKAHGPRPGKAHGKVGYRRHGGGGHGSARGGGRKSGPGRGGRGHGGGGGGKRGGGGRGKRR